MREEQRLQEKVVVCLEPGYELFRKNLIFSFDLGRMHRLRRDVGLSREKNLGV